MHLLQLMFDYLNGKHFRKKKLIICTSLCKWDQFYVTKTKVDVRLGHGFVFYSAIS